MVNPNPLGADTKEQIEEIILKILFDEKSVKSTTLLTEKVLSQTFEDKITISEKNIKLIINQMKDEKKIKFSQKEGWKIEI
jgi:3-hydroxy-3-methylglutaryl CoA synthase